MDTVPQVIGECSSRGEQLARNLLLRRQRPSLWAILAAGLACGVMLLAGAGQPHSVHAETGKDGPLPADRLGERRVMVETQLQGWGRTPVTDKVVLQAMLKVPRHLFVPESQSAHAYDDSAVPIGHGQTISQPYIVARMTEALELKPGMKVLEIGTGSGYQAALLAEITRQVYTIEIIIDLYHMARDRLKKLGYASCTVRNGDGYYGLPESAPFDRIIVTCAALHIPPPLWEQLSPGGRMIIPVGGPYEVQRLLLVAKDSEGKRSSRTLELVRFVPLVTDAMVK